MKRLGLISQVAAVVKKDGKFIRNPAVITDKYIEDGEIAYGEFLKGEEGKKAREFLKTASIDLELLDKAVNDVIRWRNCLWRVPQRRRRKESKGVSQNSFN
jgi:6-oxo-cyclohex-1-ene-carbonyl-CoA hydrolase